MKQYLLLILLAITPSLKAMDESEALPAPKRIRLSSELPSEKRYACDHPGCNQVFKKNYILQRHIRVHTGERPYPCEHAGCSSTFKHSHHLTNHMRVHTEEKPFACPYEGCSSTFKQSNHLKNHKKRKHSDDNPKGHEEIDESESSSAPKRIRLSPKHISKKKYPCKYEGCQLAFKYLCELLRHIRTHTGEKPFVCDQVDCGSAFAQSGDLTRHTKQKHPDNNPEVYNNLPDVPVATTRIDIDTLLADLQREPLEPLTPYRQVQTGEYPLEQNEDRTLLDRLDIPLVDVDTVRADVKKIFDRHFKRM